MEAAHREGQESAIGVWVAYHGDFSDLAAFPDELSALRYAADNFMNVQFIPFGESFRVQIQERPPRVHHQRSLA